MTTRRQFLARLASGTAAAALGAPRARAQQRGMVMHDTSVVSRDSSNLFVMDQNAAREVRLAPKPNAVPVLNTDARDALEHRIRCQCGCTLDVYTCRTTDFSCRVSPAMHANIIDLVQGGHSAQEIIDAFVGTYGERVLMAPKKSGFDLLAWITPGAALVVAGVGLVLWLKRWRERSSGVAAARATFVPPTNIDATPEELARLQAAVRGDD
jgi:cytochrome c-type biogenesis protein CcmH